MYIYMYMCITFNIQNVWKKSTVPLNSFSNLKEEVLSSQQKTIVMNYASVYKRYYINHLLSKLRISGNWIKEKLSKIIAQNYPPLKITYQMKILNIVLRLDWRRQSTKKIMNNYLLLSKHGQDDRSTAAYKQCSTTQLTKTIPNIF